MWIIAAIGAAALGIWSAVGYVTSDVDHPPYRVISQQDAFELREYEPMIVAQTTTTGTRDEAINAGFKIIAAYIFGDNQPKQKIAMTAPVTQQSGEKIAMTAPVTQQAEKGAWKVRFVMPKEYTLESLPKPNDARVTLHKEPHKRFAVVRFSGWVNDAALKEKTAALMAYIEANKWQALDVATYAFYNPPWTPPFQRRNEILVEVK